MWTVDCRVGGISIIRIGDLSQCTIKHIKMDVSDQSSLCSPRWTESEEEDSPTRSQLKKNNKPLLERKRRARINSSLEQLKTLVLDALKKDSARYSKLEKADILEMTVKHLKDVQQHRMTAAMNVDPTVIAKYQDGYSVCAQEVHRYLGSVNGVNSDVQMRLMNHLTNSMNQKQQMTSFPHGPVYNVPCASPTLSLPGMCTARPFGGLGVTSQSPTFPVHQVSDQAPKHLVNLENCENIAPSRPMLEKTNNLNLLTRSRQGSHDCGDNNNNVCPPAAKRQRLDIKHEYSNHYDNKMDFKNVPELQVKRGPMWRPW